MKGETLALAAKYSLPAF